MTISIVTACDERFAPGLAALLSSIAAYAPNSGVHVLDCGVSDSTRNWLEELFVRARFIKLDVGRDLPSPSVGSHATYARIFIGDFFDGDRVLYLDADTLLLSTIDALEAIHLPDNCVVAACREPYTPTFASHNGILDHQVLGLSGTTPYFNAGVLLIDVARWRAARVKERALDYLRRHDVRITLYDQEALNVVLASRWHELDPVWNVSKYWATQGSAVWRHMMAAARIVHFLSPEKPWIEPTKVEPLLMQKYHEFTRSRSS